MGSATGSIHAYRVLGAQKTSTAARQRQEAADAPPPSVICCLQRGQHGTLLNSGHYCAVFGKDEQLVFFFLLIECWNLSLDIFQEHHISIRLNVRSPTDWMFRSRWFQEGKNVSGDQFYYISLKIDYDYPVTLFPPIWSLIVKDLDVSTVPWKKRSAYAMVVGSKYFFFCPSSFCFSYWHL